MATRSRSYVLTPVLDRLARRSHFEPGPLETDCLVWEGATDDFGYGRINVDDRPVAAHRAAWIARHGQPPTETPCVLHRCDNPPCFRDEHLFLGTRADNVADMMAKGRDIRLAGPESGQGRKTHCPAGHPYNECNTYFEEGGAHRKCRACKRLRNAAAYRARQARAC